MFSANICKNEIDCILRIDFLIAIMFVLIFREEKQVYLNQIKVRKEDYVVLPSVVYRSAETQPGAPFVHDGHWSAVNDAEPG